MEYSAGMPSIYSLWWQIVAFSCCRGTPPCPAFPYPQSPQTPRAQESKPLSYKWWSLTVFIFPACEYAPSPCDTPGSICSWLRPSCFLSPLVISGFNISFDFPSWFGFYFALMEFTENLQDFHLNQVILHVFINSTFSADMNFNPSIDRILFSAYFQINSLVNTFFVLVIFSQYSESICTRWIANEEHILLVTDHAWIFGALSNTEHSSKLCQSLWK